jgi:hypothetical protein
MKPQAMGQCLKIADKVVELGLSIEKVLTVGDKHLVLLDPFGRNNRNVYCFDDQGKELWQIESAPNVDGLAKDAWTQLFPIDDKRILARTFPGFEIEIDLGSGKMIHGTGRDTK